MTQIRKAFQEAARQNALKNFDLNFRKALNETAAQTLAEKINPRCMLTVTSKNLRFLRPAKALDLLLIGISNAIEQLFANAVCKAHVDSYNAVYGKVYNDTLDNIHRQSFRKQQHTLISEFLEIHNSPTVVFSAVNGIFHALFAQIMYEKLVIAAEKEPNGKFDKMLDKLTNETVDKTLYILITLSRKTVGQSYLSSFIRQFVSELLTVYKAEDSHTRLNDTLKSVLSAYICR